MNLYQDIFEIEAVVNGFESCEISKGAFSHRSHLTVAVWYVKLNQDDATERLRAGLLRFLDHHGVGREKYNETLTRFWLECVRRLIKGLNGDPGLLETTNVVIEVLADSRLPLEYYSAERLWSEEARVGWIQPDLKAFSQLANSQTSNSS